MSKKNARYEDISLPLLPIIRIGGTSLGFIIPKNVANEYDIKKGHNFIVTLHRRTCKFSDEMSDEQLIKHLQKTKEARLEDKDKDLKNAVEELKKQL
jgi:esterase/lipase